MGCPVMECSAITKNRGTRCTKKGRWQSDHRKVLCSHHLRAIPIRRPLMVGKALWTEYRRSWRQKRISQGICIECRSPAETGRTRCSKHGEKNRMRWRRAAYSSSFSL